MIRDQKVLYLLGTAVDLSSPNSRVAVAWNCKTLQLLALTGRRTLEETGETAESLHAAKYVFRDVWGALEAIEDWQARYTEKDMPALLFHEEMESAPVQAVSGSVRVTT